MVENIQTVITRLSTISAYFQEEIRKLDAQSTELDIQNAHDRLDELNQEQIEIYDVLKSINETLYANLNSAKTLNTHQHDFKTKLGEYKVAIDGEITVIEDEKNNAVRLSKINKYYSDKYQAHSQLIKLIISILIPIIILAILKNKGFLPGDAFNALILVVIIIGGILFFKKYKDLISRDNMNYQEYDYSFRKDLAPTAAPTPEETTPEETT